MNKRIFKIYPFLLCIIILLSGCSGRGKASYSDNSLNININRDEASSEESSDTQTSSTDSSRPTTSSEKNSSKDNQSNNSSGNTSDENTSSDTFPAPADQGGTVIGTTSKGYEIRVKNGVTYIDGVLIVNKTYALPENYNPGLQSLCNKAFNKMKAAAKKDGVSIWISSGFRSFSTQKRLYESYCERDGALAADRYSARPGHSEHQSGFAIDVNSASTTAYETTYKQVGEWLKEHCWEFGFIIRYPENKEGITGYKHEPWHIRYVGTELAMKLKESGQTLEEYFGITSFYSTDPPTEEDNSSTGSDSSDCSSTESENNSELPTESEDETFSTESEGNDTLVFGGLICE